MTKKIQIQLDNLKNHFDDNDYQLYLAGSLNRQDICLKYNCTNYVLELFFKQKGWISKITNLHNNTKHNFFNKIDSPNKAYILGFYIADGCIHKDRFKISISDKDKEVLKYIKDCISPFSNLIYTKEYTNKYGIKSNPMVTINIQSKDITNKLNFYGLGYNKTDLNKSIEKIIPKKYMWDFIRGYFDGDGCVSASKVSHTIKGKIYYNWNVNWTIISKDYNILKEMQDFIKSEGINVIIYPEKRGNWLMGTHSIKNLKKIYNKLYNGEFCLNRKWNKFKEIIVNTEVSSKNKSLETP